MPENLQASFGRVGSLPPPKPCAAAVPDILKQGIFGMKRVSGKTAVIGAIVAAAFVAGFGTAWAMSQPHTEAALAFLEQALGELQIADKDRSHGGHDGKATTLVEEAIREVHLAIEYRDRH